METDSVLSATLEVPVDCLSCVSFMLSPSAWARNWRVSWRIWIRTICELSVISCMAFPLSFQVWLFCYFIALFSPVISGMAFMLFHCILFPSHFMHAFCWSFHAWLSLVISCMVFLWFHCMAIPNHFVHCFISVHKYLLLRNLEDIDIAWEINSLVLSDTHRSKLII